jgi:hypothetical protein
MLAYFDFYFDFFFFVNDKNLLLDQKEIEQKKGGDEWHRV